MAVVVPAVPAAAAAAPAVAAAAVPWHARHDSTAVSAETQAAAMEVTETQAAAMEVVGDKVIGDPAVANSLSFDLLQRQLAKVTSQVRVGLDQVWERQAEVTEALSNCKCSVQEARRRESLERLILERLEVLRKTTESLQLCTEEHAKTCEQDSDRSDLGRVSHPLAPADMTPNSKRRRWDQTEAMSPPKTNKDAETLEEKYAAGYAAALEEKGKLETERKKLLQKQYQIRLEFEETQKGLSSVDQGLAKNDTVLQAAQQAFVAERTKNQIKVAQVLTKDKTKKEVTKKARARKAKMAKDFTKMAKMAKEFTKMAKKAKEEAREKEHTKKAKKAKAKKAKTVKKAKKGSP